MVGENAASANVFQILMWWYSLVHSDPIYVYNGNGKLYVSPAHPR